MISPVFNVNLISNPNRCSPKSKINAPAIGARKPRFWRRNDPTALADAPKEIKTAENPATKASEEPKSPERGNSPLRNCSMPIPDSMDMYPGTKGKTQGDKNETSPARNAPASETSLIRQRSCEICSSCISRPNSRQAH